jgi:predicted small metal-binding protein
MAINQLTLKSGKWLVANCGKYPSEKNCQLVLMAPEDQREELLNTVVDHAVKCHGHEDSDELRTQLNNFIETVTI